MSNNVASMYAILNRLSDKSLEAIAMWVSAWNTDHDVKYGDDVR